MIPPKRGGPVSYRVRGAQSVRAAAVRVNSRYPVAFCRFDVFFGGGGKRISSELVCAYPKRLEPPLPSYGARGFRHGAVERCVIHVEPR